MPSTPAAPGVPPEQPPLISVRGLVKRYGTKDTDRLVLDGVDLDVHKGQLVCIVGPSGAGKTTLLRCMSGLLAPTAGETVLEGVTVTAPPPALALVFQDYSRSLMPWMSVRKNVELPLLGKQISKNERRRRADEALAAVGLTGSRGQYPWQLSGGMQQRVAIARALAYRPHALIMDEPFASVDAQTRADLEDLTLQVREMYEMTVILVTHDIDEAVYLGDEVVVLSGSPTRVRERITIDLGRSRDQLTTKSTPEFVALRGQVLQLIRRDRYATRTAD
ncbi:ABC transporter ATP-binding protein [Nonomuraea antimicrobica]|uniref:ABC transporter ATP-binding protein n=1 Tax=Nonomuraea antimicrobica TaxID=561173 RepID=A0ABP7E3M7_9ACTN